jgi:S1-C subfamily serine protease
MDMPVMLKNFALAAALCVLIGVAASAETRDPGGAYSTDGKYLGPRDPNSAYTVDGVLVGPLQLREITKDQSRVRFSGADPVVKRQAQDFPTRYAEILTMTSGALFIYQKVLVGGAAHDEAYNIRFRIAEAKFMNGVSFDAARLQKFGRFTYYVATGSRHCLFFDSIFGNRFADFVGDEEFYGYRYVPLSTSPAFLEQEVLGVLSRVTFDTGGGRVAGPAAHPPAQAAAAPRPQKPAPPPERAQRPRAISTGTAFAVSYDGYFVTNDHVVDDCDGFFLRLSETEKGDAKIVDRNPEFDLALVKVEFRPSAIATFRSNDVKIGEPIVVAGFPHIGTLSPDGVITTGVVSALSAGRDRNMFQMSAPVQAGNSGGPVFDSSGNVIGVTRAKTNVFKNEIAQNVNFAIKSDLVEVMMKHVKLTAEHRVSVETVSTTDISEQAFKMTGVLVFMK